MDGSGVESGIDTPVIVRKQLEQMVEVMHERKVFVTLGQQNGKVEVWP